VLTAGVRPEESGVHEAMARTRLTIVDGPLKPDLQWAVAYPEKHLHIHFETDNDPVDVHLDRLEELGEGTSFGLVGHIVSSNYKGRPFKAVYHLSDRGSEQRGILEISDPEDQ
jgi:hypothetical protein